MHQRTQGQCFDSTASSDPRAAELCQSAPFGRSPIGNPLVSREQDIGDREPAVDIRSRSWFCDARSTKRG